jgi:hypothetical protein
MIVGSRHLGRYIWISGVIICYDPTIPLCRQD